MQKQLEDSLNLKRKMFVARPLYEKKEHLEHEQKTAKKIATTYGLRLRKMHMKHGIDFMAFDKSGRAVAVFEVKRRHLKHDDRSHVILSLTKYNRGLEFDRVNDLNFNFVVDFDDGLFVYEHKHGDSFKIIFGGRTDRGDSQDLEPVVQIPISRMEKL